MSPIVAQDATALRAGVDETSRRFEDLFDRGDAAGTARHGAWRRHVDIWNMDRA